MREGTRASYNHWCVVILHEGGSRQHFGAYISSGSYEFRGFETRQINCFTPVCIAAIRLGISASPAPSILTMRSN